MPYGPEWSREGEHSQRGSRERGRFRGEREEYNQDFEPGYSRQSREDERMYSQQGQRYSQGYNPEYSDYGRGGRSDNRSESRGDYQSGAYQGGGHQGFGASRNQQNWPGYGSSGFEQGMSGRGSMGQGSESSWGRESQSQGRGMSNIGSSLRGKGPKGYRRSDERIKEEVSDKLMQHDEIDASEITVMVKDCEVTLQGTVEDRHQKRLAEEIIEELPGVEDVNNQLRVKKSSERSEGREEMGGQQRALGGKQTTGREREKDTSASH